MGHTRRTSRLTQRELALIHLAKTRLGLQDDAYRDLLESVTGVRSAREMAPEDVPALLRRFARLGFTARPPARDYGHRPGMATPAQLDYIRALWHRYAGGTDERGLGRWLHKRFGVSHLRFLDCTMAHQTLVALKAMTTRHRREASPPAP